MAFDDSENAMRAVEFIEKFFTSDSKVMLFNVMQDTAALCEMNSPELTPYFKSQQSSFCKLEEKKKNLVDSALKKAREKLIDAGFKAKNITIKAKSKKKGLQGISLKKRNPVITLLSWGEEGSPGLRILSLAVFHKKCSTWLRIFPSLSLIRSV